MAGQAVDEGPTELLRVAVDPLQVLDQDDERPILGTPQHEGFDRFDRPTLALRLVQTLALQLSRGQREQVLEVGQCPLERRIQPAHAGLELLDLLAFGLALLQPEGRLEELDNDVEWQRWAVGQAVALDIREGRLEPLALQLVEQARLADAGLAHDRDDLAAAAPGPLAALAQKRQLPGAPDQRHEPPLDRDLEARAPPALPGDPPGADRVVDPLDAPHATILGDEVAAHEPMSGLTNQDSARRRFRLQPRRQIDRLALRRVVHAEVVADLPHDDGARVQPDAHREVDPALAAQRLGILALRALDRDGRRHCPHRVILVGDRRSEERHDAIARELVDRALVAVNRLHEVDEAPVHDTMEVLRVESGRQRREADTIDEQHRHLLALALQRAAGGEDLLGQVPRGVARGLAREPIGHLGHPARGRCTGGGRTLAPQRVTALVAELGGGPDGCPARGTAAGQPRAATIAERRSGPILAPTLWARHDDILSSASGRATRARTPSGSRTSSAVRKMLGEARGATTRALLSPVRAGWLDGTATSSRSGDDAKDTLGR